MIKKLVRFAPLIGAVIIAQSVLWEFSRMTPNYRRIVFPWSIRGTETTHGTSFVAIAVTLAIVALLVGWERSQESPLRYGIVAAAVAGPVIVAALFTDSSDGVTLGPISAIGIGVAIGIMATLSIRDLEAEKFPVLNTLWFGAVLVLVLGGLSSFLVLAVTDGGDREIAPVVLIAGIFIALGAYSLLREPRELAVNRMMIFASVAAWITVTMQAGAIRVTLLRLQSEFTGSAFGYELTNISGEYKDSQVTSGWFLANLGAVIVMFAAVAMWARRRDYIISMQRAHKQRAAAEKSAAEIKEAIELYQAQKKAAAAAAPGTPPPAPPDAGSPSEG